MALTQLTSNLNIIQALDRYPNANNGLTYAQLQAKFDEAAGLIKTFLNSTLIAELGSTTDGSSGADNVGATAIANLTGTTVQSLLESLRNNLKATTDGSSGADFVAATAITSLTGNTVQAILESLRDALKATTDSASGADFVAATAISGLSGTTVQALLEAINSALTTHKSSSDHDGRYYTETELNAGQLNNLYYTETELNNGQLDTRYYTETELNAGQLDNRYYTEAEVDGFAVKLTGNQTVAGIKTFSSFPVTPSSAPTTDYQISNKKYVDDTTAAAAAGVMPDGSVTNAKLATDVKVGSLASLTTTAKSSVQGAINELDGEIGTLSSLTTTSKSTLVGAINEVDSDLGTLSSSLTSHQNNTSVHTTIMTTEGDMIYRGASTPERLPKGTARQALLMNSGATAPEWGSSLQSLMTGQGDIVYASGSNTPARLAKGTAYQGLLMNSGATAPEWSASLQSVMTAAGDIVYASAANTPARLAKGTDSQVLTLASGVPSWAEKLNVAFVTGTDTSTSIAGSSSYNKDIALGCSPKVCMLSIYNSSNPGWHASFWVTSSAEMVYNSNINSATGDRPTLQTVYFNSALTFLTFSSARINGGTNMRVTLSNSSASAQTLAMGWQIMCLY